MKKTALRFGLYGVYTIIVFFLIEWLIFRNSNDHLDFREIVGWAGILLATCFVYFGLKYYRDQQNHGALSFAEGLKLGVMMILFPAMAFGVFNVFYIMVLDPEFLDTYYNYQVEQMKLTVPLSELESKLNAVQREKEMFGNPLVQFITMFLSVFCTGLIVTIISTLILKRKTVRPALA